MDQNFKIVFPQPRKAELQSFEISSLQPTEIDIKTTYSLLSTGTEGLIYKGEYDKGTHWDQWIKYPFEKPGYATIGKVLNLGSEVSRFKVGDTVAVWRGHASRHVAMEAECHLIPNEIDPLLAPWWAMSKIGIMAARDAEVKLTDSVLIIGAGPIGQMVIRWVNAMGARNIIVVDPVEARLIHAQKGGATRVIGKPLGSCITMVKSENGLMTGIFDGGNPDIVIDTTGNPAVFILALSAVKNRGKVILLGDPGSPASQCLSHEVLVKGLTIKGSHAYHVYEPWTETAICEMFFNLIKTKRFNLDGLNTHVFKPQQCAEAYELALLKRNETMGIIFDWN